jgi:hypothetical protein
MYMKPISAAELELVCKNFPQCSGFFYVYSRSFSEKKITKKNIARVESEFWWNIAAIYTVEKIK